MPGSFVRGLSAALTYFSSIVPVQYSEARSPRMNFDVPVLTINLRFTNDWLEITYDWFPIDFSFKHHRWESWVAVVE